MSYCYTIAGFTGKTHHQAETQKTKTVAVTYPNHLHMTLNQGVVEQETSKTKHWLLDFCKQRIHTISV